VAYDRDEWRTPWRAEPTSAPDPGPAGSGAVASDPDPARRSDPSAAAPTTTASGAAAAGTAGASAASAASSSAASSTTGTSPGSGPIARFPQPPPSSWDATAAGPGSPPGSVRPPDTTGTHDAPAAPKRGRTLATAMVGGLVGALVGGGLVAAVVDTGSGPTSLAGGGGDRAPSIEVDGSDAGGIVPTVAEAVLPSVVSIDVPSSALGGGGPLGGEGGPGGAAMGSGVIYRSDGYILTNAHVVGEAEEATVRLASGDVLSAEVVGTDELNDLAVLLADGDDVDELPAINLRELEEDLTVGETVIAIGSPFGLDGSVTTGIVSGLNRDLTVGEEDGAGLTIPAVIQTDAAINPGNSGGALVDGQGRLVGINTAILTRTGGSQGVGFAVPAAQAVSSADQIIDQGFVRHPLLGISGTDIDPAAVEELGLEDPRGAIVDSVQPGTGAEEADIRSGDVIVSVDGEPLATMSQLVGEVRDRAPGDSVTLSIIRDGDELDVEVTLSERPRS
jgi:S1-C subfamily serine protease